jgi:hypothetical protein
MVRAVSEIEREIRALGPDDQEHLLRALLAIVRACLSHGDSNEAARRGGLRRNS